MSSLVPFPISIPVSYILNSIPCNQSWQFCSFFYTFMRLIFDSIFLFLLLSIIIAITQNLKLISLKKIFLISIVTAVISLISSNLAGFLWYDSYKDPNLSLLKLGPPIISINILNIFTQIFLQPLIISLSLYLIFKKLALQKAIIISLVVFLVIIQWLYIPLFWQSSEQSVQRGLVLKTTGPKSETKFFSGIKHEIISEEVINDSNNPKYKSLRINVKLTIPEPKSYALYGELRDKTNNNVAVQSYINGKSLTTSAIVIDLNKGENFITFDFPYAYFNDYVKREVINLPYNDTETGSYGPYRFTFRLSSTNYEDIVNKAALNSSDVSKLIYDPPVYTTRNTYNYLDFYQR